MRRNFILTATLLALSPFSCSKDMHGARVANVSKKEIVATEPTVTIDLSPTTQSKIKIGKEFYGADSHGFSELPPAPLVRPLQLGFVKLGGSLHATYNWELNAYFNEKEIFYVYAPLVRRLQYIQNSYRAEPMFQVNMLGWQPELTSTGELVYKNTANAQHAGNAIRYLNGINKIGIKHIMMGNEPFESEEYHDIHIPSADEYIEKYIDYAMELRKAQEAVSGNPNDIKLWGPEIATGWTGWQTNSPQDCIFDYEQDEPVQCSYGNGKFKEFVPYFLSRLKAFENDKIKNPNGYKMLDYITFHYYALFRTEFKDPTSILRDKDGNQNVAAMLESVNVWDSLNYINRYDGASPKGKVPMIMHKIKRWRETYYPNAKISITECGVDSVANIDYHPIVRPLYLADIMPRLGAAGVDTFINSFLQSGSVTNSWAMIDGQQETRLYKIYSLFSNYFLGDILSISDNLGDLVNAYAVKNTQGINIFVVNKDISKHTTNLQFQNNKELLNISSVELPPWSLTVLNVSPDTKKMTILHQYGAKEMGISVDLKY